MIFFVGDRPSSKNVSPGVAFVGTKSHKTLLGWLADMRVDTNDSVICNIDQFKEYSFGGDWSVNVKCTDVDIMHGDLFVALGKVAEKGLLKRGFKPYLMPHPSGRNRKLNNEKWLNQELRKCKEWLKCV